jgi:hypothetical protein
MRGLKRDPGDRFGSAREMAAALRKAMAPAESGAIGEWVRGLGRERLARRAAFERAIESLSAPGNAAERERERTPNVWEADELGWDSTGVTSSTNALKTTLQSGRRTLLRRAAGASVLVACAMLIVSLVSTRGGATSSPAAAAAPANTGSRTVSDTNALDHAAPPPSTTFEESYVPPAREASSPLRPPSAAAAAPKNARAKRALVATPPRASAPAAPTGPPSATATARIPLFGRN